ncbi:MAG: protein kinase, partial [Pirellulaceae bacterium]|nr:protein kinase [Pirellulaceae bacterium]
MTAQPLAKEIFQNAIEITHSAQRDAFVTGACRGDEGLFQKVAELLEAHFEKDSWLDPRRARAPHESPMTESLELPERVANVSVGTQIGNYKLLEQIGAGGMGIVFMAEQLKPIRRKVALKIIKPGMDTSQVIARFEAERQALALMDHPNIAHVLDAGATDSGRPYFVMELVRGIPITEYCDKNRLDTPERLKLFAKVCQAVQHAHNKGIIHRDIK